MNINIRIEEPKDYRRVEKVAREAFWNLYFPGCHEHFVIHKMRKHKDFIRDLAFVIEVDDQIAGGIFYTHSKIVSKENKEYKTISFGPVFISPEFPLNILILFLSPINLAILLSIFENSLLYCGESI